MEKYKKEKQEKCDKQKKIVRFKCPSNECGIKKGCALHSEGWLYASEVFPRAVPRNIMERECASLRKWKAPAPDATALVL